MAQQYYDRTDHNSQYGSRMPPTIAEIDSRPSSALSQRSAQSQISQNSYQKRPIQNLHPHHHPHHQQHPGLPQQVPVQQVYGQGYANTGSHSSLEPLPRNVSSHRQPDAPPQQYDPRYAHIPPPPPPQSQFHAQPISQNQHQQQHPYRTQQTQGYRQDGYAQRHPQQYLPQEHQQVHQQVPQQMPQQVSHQAPQQYSQQRHAPQPQQRSVSQPAAYSQQHHHHHQHQQQPQQQPRFQNDPPILQPSIIEQRTMDPSRTVLPVTIPPPKARSEPTRTQTLPALNTKRTDAVPQRLPQETTPKGSPVSNSSGSWSPMRQSLNFFGRSGRSVSSGALLSDNGNGAKPAGNFSQGVDNSRRTMSMRSLTGDKNKSKPATTLSGRVIPQKNDTITSVYHEGSLPNQQLSNRSKSYTSLTNPHRSSSTSTLRHTDRSVSQTSLASRTIVTVSSRKPSVYPALLSKVAKAFFEKIELGSNLKNGLEYRDSFTGTQAVDVISHIIRTSDRSLAMLLGRALDAQHFFHDVTYEHRLRDSQNEVYQFGESIFNPYGERQEQQNGPDQQISPNPQEEEDVKAVDTGVNGVFTLLTECYSATCTRNQLCYSIACPRRLEQQARLNMKPQGGLRRSESKLSLSGDDEKKHLWSLNVPKQVLESVDKREIQRQECIFETIYSERDFIKDLEYLRDFWIRPLSESRIIKEQEREKFIRSVFSGINEIWAVNSRLADALTRRQQRQPIVEQVGDIFLEFIPKFEPFVKYGAGQVFGKYEFDRQKKTNALFARFVEETGNLPESRRLDLSSYLSKPTSRPARYPLLLKSIRDATDPSNPDYEKLGKAIDMLQGILNRINQETGKASDRLNILLLKQKLIFRPGELVDLKLADENRRLLFQCVLKKKSYQDKENQGEVNVYLFDHALIFARVKIMNKKEVYRVYQRPIPIPLLFVSLSEEMGSMRHMKRSPSTGSLYVCSQTTSSASYSHSSTTTLSHSASLSTLTNTNSARFPLTFSYLGRNGYEFTLYARQSVQRTLLEKVEQQHKKLIKDNDIFTLTRLSSSFFDYSNRINCAVPFDGGRRLLYGTDSGIYISNIRKNKDKSRIVSRPVKVIAKTNIMQLEVLEEYQLLLALCDKKLHYWPLEILNDDGSSSSSSGGNGASLVSSTSSASSITQVLPPNPIYDPNKNAKLGKEMMSHVSFFKSGVCSGRMLICVARNGSQHLIKIFEPMDPITSKKMNKRKFKNEVKDLTFSSEPVSVSFLKTKLCIGCTKGFEIVQLETGVQESLLDQADTSLDFCIGKEGLKPLRIDRVNNNFLLSYSNFSFYVNKNGWRARPNFLVNWENVPSQFAMWYPSLLSFDSQFIEVRNVETGELTRCIAGENIRFLHSSSQEILFVWENEQGYDTVVSLDFWDKSVPKVQKDQES
ncbi:unnamed protein product [Kuraishia capsulata CBS 1993]|uniref:DH domain-containing protein n=1 Tax=Kuraishia capsulata CBS 1993 TaxID=1382522 RepID=W6MH55_9ASCO|nr:uncharacterized protein KUCA_T00000940001 [Kuraishia capsulata CBS 1993]CDK24973.1 unnamed protein product [Kuraishia capsulata CBS 1993]